jgi:hypothetical protein
MKKVFLALVAAAALAPTAVWAQGFSVGPGGVRIDSGDRYERPLRRRSRPARVA